MCFDTEKAVNAGYAHRVHWVVLGLDSRLPECALPNETVHQYHLDK
ncbi:hypothetical protein [Paraglaciecola sp.]